MSKLEKLVASLLSDAGEYDFSDTKKVLITFGFVESRVKGSHHVFKHKDGRRQVIPVKHGKKVKKFYVKETVELLQLKEWYEKRRGN
ncbi:MAG: type II toxin-antitoxin system HicA family toxin [Cyanobacteria bacterium J06560_6]